jgi:hypothetical protein
MFQYLKREKVFHMLFGAVVWLQHTGQLTARACGRPGTASTR